jgi:hypothetical protein
MELNKYRIALSVQIKSLMIVSFAETILFYLLILMIYLL